MHTPESIYKQFQLLNDWFISALEGISDEDGKKTLGDAMNSLEWLAGHLVVGRYRNMLRVGMQVEPYQHLDTFINQSIPPPNAIAFDPNITYPSLAESRETWIHYSTLFLARLKEIDAAGLTTEIPFHVPTGGNTVKDALAFTVMHETYHIGQMSTMRKMLGYGSMQLGPRK